ncbi:hypothetical protein WJX82_010292 [Trebouxia sp. C0006]
MLNVHSTNRPGAIAAAGIFKVSRKYKNQVRALFNELFQDGLESPEAFLDQLLQMTSLADIVEECVAMGCAPEAATQLAELLMRKEEFAGPGCFGRAAQNSVAGGLREGASSSRDAVRQEDSDKTGTLAQPGTFQAEAA